MKARPRTIGLLTVVLGTMPVLAQTETKPEAPGANQPGQMEKRRQELLKRFDMNGAGQLDPEERAAARQAFLADHPELVPPRN